MRQFACRYAVLRFAPYSETEEFANVGVVLACPQTGYLGFQLEVRRHKRVTDFFEELPPAVYRQALQLMQAELNRLAQRVAQVPPEQRADFTRRVFEQLVHPREAMMRFGTARALLTDDPAAEVHRQFSHYVDRSFATPEHLEQVLERRIKVWLSSLGLERPFREARVGDDDLYAKFSLVQLRGTQPVKIIKPFNLSHDKPVDIYDHGGRWVDKLRRLRRRNLLPHDVLFALASPPHDGGKRHAAFNEIRSELTELEIVTVDETEQGRIAEFAQG